MFLLNIDYIWKDFLWCVSSRYDNNKTTSVPPLKLKIEHVPSSAEYVCSL